MEVLIFLIIFIILVFFIDYFRFKKDLMIFLEDLYYDTEILKIDRDNYQDKINKLFNKKV